MDYAFERKVRAAAIAGWWTLLIGRSMCNPALPEAVLCTSGIAGPEI